MISYWSQEDLSSKNRQDKILEQKNIVSTQEWKANGHVTKGKINLKVLLSITYKDLTLAVYNFTQSS